MVFGSVVGVGFRSVGFGFGCSLLPSKKKKRRRLFFVHWSCSVFVCWLVLMGLLCSLPGLSVLKFEVPLINTSFP